MHVDADSASSAGFLSRLPPLLASDWSLSGKAVGGRGEDPGEACPCPTAWPDTETFPPCGQTEILPNLSLHVVQLILYGQGQDG